ncbi:MAG: hypothetical protein ACLUEV_02700 [Alistipes sp.]
MKNEKNGQQHRQQDQDRGLRKHHAENAGRVLPLHLYIAIVRARVASDEIEASA